MAYILGSGRSGTTLLRVMLAGHPRLFSPPEMVLAPFATMREREEHMKQRYWDKGGLRRALMFLRDLDVDAAKQAVAELADQTVPEVYARLGELAGDRLLVDKCPHLAYSPEHLRRTLEWFPDARFLYIVRHPGSVIRSFQNMPMAEVMLQGAGVENAEDAWLTANRNIREFLADVPEDRWTTIRYEDLVENPRPIMERVCATLGVEFDEAVLDPYAGDRMREGPKGARAIGDPNMAGRGKIQKELADAWISGFDKRKVSAETTALAKALGYDLDALPLPPIADVSAALDALWDTARELERSIELPMDLDALEGRRFLLRMLAASVDTFVEHSDVDRPRFAHAEGPHRKMFADCPDTDYLRAPIRTDEGRVYVLRGRIPAGTTYVGVLLYGKGGRVGANLRDDQLRLDDDGNFELRVSTQVPADAAPGTWLKAEGDETALMVRQYYSDRGTQTPIEPSLSVDLEGDRPAPTPLDAKWLARRLELSRRMLSAVFERTLGAYQMASAMALNRFVAIPADQLFPTPDNEYRVCWFRFGRDQLMLLRGRVPKARYFSLTLCNAWMESYDASRHTIILNHHQLQTDDEGNFEVALAHRDLGHPNWLDTAGHQAGYVIVRALCLEGEVAQIETQVMYETEFASPE
jgi:hypothetical protein